MTMLQLEQVRKTYRMNEQNVEALRGVDLRLEGPGFFAVMGRSGSGKSTLMHLAAGLDQPDAGRVVVAGKSLGDLSESQLTDFRRRSVGIVFQRFNLISTMTAYENAALPGVVDGRPRAWIDQRVGELFKLLRIDHRMKHRPDALSGGEQQRVAIARAMMFSPPLLLADEPTGNLDSAASEQVWRLLASLAKEHQMTIVMVTHEAAAAVHTDHVYVLADGQAKGDFKVNGLDHSGVASRYQQLGG